jgi:hypothetical protein
MRDLVTVGAVRGRKIKGEKDEPQNHCVCEHFADGNNSHSSRWVVEYRSGSGSHFAWNWRFRF